VWRFTGYRPTPPESYYARDAANAPDDPQYQGVVFDDGTVVCRWLTGCRSHSIWASWGDFYQVHEHPEYGTRITWPDGRAPVETPPAPHS